MKDHDEMREWMRAAAARNNQRVLDDYLMSVAQGRVSSRKNIVPGCLVRPRRNVHVPVWQGYETRVSPDGITRATMKTALRNRLVDQALVLCRPLGSPGGKQGTGVVGLFVPAQGLFCYTWDSYLFLLSPAGGAQ